MKEHTYTPKEKVMGNKNKEYYSIGVKVVLSNIRNIMCVELVRTPNTVRYAIYNSKGTIFYIREEEFNILAPLFGGLSEIESKPRRYARVYLAKDISRLFDKLKEIENATGEEEYTEVLTLEEEHLMKTLETIQKNMIESMNTLYHTRRI